MPRKSHQAASSSSSGVGAFVIVGLALGAAVGVDDGVEVGTVVGTVVGTCVGTGTGIGVGCGDAVGASVGTAVGSAVGSAVGRAVGTALGEADGAAVCACATATSNAYRARQPGRSISSCSCVTFPSALLLGSPQLPSMATQRPRASAAASITVAQSQMEICEAATELVGWALGVQRVACNECLRVFQRSTGKTSIGRPTLPTVP